MRRWIVVTPLLLGVVAVVALAADSEERRTESADAQASAVEKGMVVPEYDERGAMLRPKNYEGWVFVGASIGLRYAENAPPDETGVFRNIYMQPEAYEEYARTGYFPDKTIFVMENFEPVQKESINRSGFFEGKFLGMEAAVKDYDRSDLGWSYYNFSGPKGLVEKARPFPRAICWDCHAEHGEDDNVFVQFYPILKRARQ